MYCLFNSRSPPVTIPVQMGYGSSVPVEIEPHSRSGNLSPGNLVTGLLLPFYNHRKGMADLLRVFGKIRHNPNPFTQNIDNHD